jgi:hypothetical protein
MVKKIISIKPLRKKVFIKINLLTLALYSLRKFRLQKHQFLLHIFFSSRFGTNQSLLRVQSIIPFNQKFAFIFSLFQRKLIFSYFEKTLAGFLFPFYINFKLIGYHYKIFKKRKKTRRLGIRFRMGFFDDYMFVFSKGIYLKRKKREFMLYSGNFVQLMMLSVFIRYIRNTFPYKNKGFSFVNDNPKLKVGKVVKFK